MGLTALILGILAVILSLIPFCNYIGLIPAIIGVVMGVVALTQPDDKYYNSKALSITGIVFCMVAVSLSVVWSVLFLIT